MMINQQAARLPWLDVARGVAACLVVLSHVAGLSWVPWNERLPTFWERAIFALGSPSVDLFFVLSGFVVARACLSSPMSWSTYMRWRLIRLLPVAWMGLGLGWLVRQWINTHNSIFDGVWPHLALPISAMDWSAFVTLIYPFNADFAKVNIALWSLQAEMLFVLCLPILLLALRRFPWVMWVFISMLCLFLTLILSSIYFLYLPLFMLGMLLAMHPPRVRPTEKSAGVWLLMGLIWMVLSNVAVELWQTDVGLGILKRYLDMWGAAAIILALAQWNYAPARALHFLGRISYSLYAIHLPVMMLVAWLLNEVFGVNYWLGGLLSIPVALLMAVVLHVAVEQKVLAWSRKFRNKAIEVV
ncbi:MAG: acyltransferase family protein [Formosimonas sp.]